MGHNRDESDGNRELKKPVIIVGNKADIEGSLDYFQMLELELAEEWPVSLVSAEEEVGFDPEPSVPLSAIGGLSPLDVLKGLKALPDSLDITALNPKRLIHNSVG